MACAAAEVFCNLAMPVGIDEVIQDAVHLIHLLYNLEYFAECSIASDMPPEAHSDNCPAISLNARFR